VEAFFMPSQTVLTEVEIRRALTRIAHEIVERNRGAHDLVLIGIPTRGVPLAQRIAAAIASFEGVIVPVNTLDIGLYRDDLARRGVAVRLGRSEMAADIQGKRVVLVDDVLFTGRSVRAALDALIDFGRPERIQLAVLIDRGHRELPIRADYVGRNIPTHLTDDVQVRLTETDGYDEVTLLTRTME
jgi:pyrimidine operon attenuation protein/uracil phosphoribosyltransferase